MKYSRPRGTQDIIPPDVYIWQSVERIFEETFASYGYQPIRTPAFESTELFQRAVGEYTDIITKEMYVFTDRGGRSLTLRPENTASVVRAYLENGMHRIGGIIRLYYTGPMFRYDRPQAGRYRQFHQVGVEAIGSLNPALDVEIIDVSLAALDSLGFKDLIVKLNSVGCAVCRGDYKKVLTGALEDYRDRLCEDCRERAQKNPLRIFDCKQCDSVKKDLPPISSHLCAECADHFKEVQAGLATLGRKYENDPYLVRGLDYYTRTTYEILHRGLGAQNALCGGGRYDNLVEECGGPPTPAVGFSAGLERIISVLPDESPAKAAFSSAVDFYIACADPSSTARALAAAKTLRRLGSVVVDFSLRAMKTQLKSAEKRGAVVTVIVDSTRGTHLVWKDMSKREQYEVEDGALLDFASGHTSKKGGPS